MTSIEELKGVILAGGKGVRLERNTTVTNKHLVRVGKYPMIEYPLATLRRMGITDITVVTGAEHEDAIKQYLKTWYYPDRDFPYFIQQEAGGIAQALALTEPVVKGHKIAVILGDNIFEDDFSEHAQRFLEQDIGAMLFLKAVPDPQRFGVAEISGEKIISIEEKPHIPKSNLAVTGLYFYDTRVFEKIKMEEPSKRGELEITGVNNRYIQESGIRYALIRSFWSDAGTLPSLQHCEEWLKESTYDPLKW